MKLKELLLTGLAGLLIMAPTSVFAEESEKEERDWQEFRLEQVAEYTPDQVAEWNRLFESKEVLKAEREALKDELADPIENVWKPMMDEVKEEYKALVHSYAEELKLQVENEEITKEDATALLQAFKDDLKADHIAAKAEREADKLEREADKVYYDALREERKALNESIKLAIENDETSAVAGYLNAILVINQELEAHAIQVNQAIQDRINEIDQ